MKTKEIYPAVAHELVFKDGVDMHCFETGERDYQVWAAIGDVDDLDPPAQAKQVLVRASTPTQALKKAVATGEFDRLDFDSVSDTLTLHVGRRPN
jgi:hypothetical protein